MINISWGEFVSILISVCPQPSLFQNSWFHAHSLSSSSLCEKNCHTIFQFLQTFMQEIEPLSLTYYYNVVLACLMEGKSISLKINLAYKQYDFRLKKLNLVHFSSRYYLFKFIWYGTGSKPTPSPLSPFSFLFLGFFCGSCNFEFFWLLFLLFETFSGQFSAV